VRCGKRRRRFRRLVPMCSNSLKELLGFKRLSIVHVNHRLRGGESDADALFVKNMAQGAGLEFFLKELEKPPGMTGLEEWGRRERYAFFSRIRETEGFSFIATGHTADDQAETVLMRIHTRLRAQRPAGPFCPCAKTVSYVLCLYCQGTASAPGLPRGKSNSGRFFK